MNPTRVSAATSSTRRPLSKAKGRGKGRADMKDGKS
jgi:hypothetical protein